MGESRGEGANGRGSAPDAAPVGVDGTLVSAAWNETCTPRLDAIELLPGAQDVYEPLSELTKALVTRLEDR